MKWHTALLAGCLALATMEASAEPLESTPFGKPRVGCSCPARSSATLHEAVRPLAGLQLAAQRPVILESTISRSGVWDGALLLGDRDKLETRLWWQNLTAKDYDSVFFRAGGNGTFALLESQPSAYGLTLKLRF